MKLLRLVVNHEKSGGQVVPERKKSKEKKLALIMMKVEAQQKDLKNKEN